MSHRILVVGSGGREHALGWALTRSPSVDAVESAPGNPGLAELGPTHAVQPLEPNSVAQLAEDRSCDLVVVGPEAPLVAGLADELRRRNVPVFGPTAAAARIEASKSFAKDVMNAAGVPTARHATFTDARQALAALHEFDPPYVVKADGLAAGKGVRVCHSRPEAESAIEDALVRRVFGEAGARIVVEEFLDGPEVSVFAVCDGSNVVLLPPAQDFKRAYEADAGPNTGGMGAYTPVAGFGADEAVSLRRTVFEPVLLELGRRDLAYTGVLYAGLVLTDDGPKVLEFNCRFGDPEIQALAPLVTSDFADLLVAATDPARGVRNVQVDVADGACVTVVLASGGYPGSYDIGHEITGVDRALRDHPDALVFHAGTRRDDGKLLTAGGRVLSVTGRGDDVAAARIAAYAAADEISFAGMFRRDDIAAEAAAARR